MSASRTASRPARSSAIDRPVTVSHNSADISGGPIPGSLFPKTKRLFNRRAEEALVSSKPVCCDQTSERAPSAANQYRHPKLAGTWGTKWAKRLDVIEAPSRYRRGAGAVNRLACQVLQFAIGALILTT